MQFQNDWPGLFVRGDTAIHPRGAIRTVDEALAGCQDAGVRNALYELRQIADIIQREVMVPGPVPVLKPLK